MWKKGFKILQNIKNQCLLWLVIPKRLDQVTNYTVNKLDTDGKSKEKKATREEGKDLIDIQGYVEFSK